MQRESRETRDWPLLFLGIFLILLGVWLILDASETYNNAYDLVVGNCRVGGKLNFDLVVVGGEEYGINWTEANESGERDHIGRDND